MNKGNPADLHALAEDLKGVIHRHPDAIMNNPDIASEVVKVRDKTMERWESLKEKPRK